MNGWLVIAGIFAAMIATLLVIALLDLDQPTTPEEN